MWNGTPEPGPVAKRLEDLVPTHYVGGLHTATLIVRQGSND